jgi:hypothetical protein
MLTRNQVEFLDRIAGEEGVSRAEIVRRLIEAARRTEQGPCRKRRELTSA